MTTESSGLQEAIRAAMNAASADEVISGVKSIVASEVAALDSSLDIEYTDYFNHTYMPDMVMRWRGSDETRPVYIRNRLNVGVTASEVRGLGRTEPVVLGLTSVDSETAGAVRNSVGSRGRTFITDVASVNALAANEPLGDASPLMQVVRSSILRIGRGLLDEDDAAALSDAASRAVSTKPEIAAQGLEDLEATASHVYANDGIHQISRVGQLIQSVATGNPSGGFEADGGRLSLAEARILIPYMLNRKDIPADSPIWNRLSALIDLDLVEDMHELEGLDLSRLLTEHALDTWTVTRATLVERAADEEVDSQGSWFLRSGLLTTEVDHWTLAFAASDKRRLKGRVDSLSANWQDIAPAVRPLIVDSADLRGISRRVTISTEESGNVVRDIASLTESIPDSYRVTSLGVRVPGSESESTIDIEFTKMLASVNSGVLPVGELGSAALLLLGYRNPAYPSWLRAGRDDGATQ